MRTIKRSHIEAWIKTMTAAGLAPGTMATRYNNVRAVFRAAKRDKVIGSDPAEEITLPRRRRPEVAMRIPTPETVGTIMAAAEVWFAPFIGLCAFAGLRLGEAAGVQLDDIDFLRRTLTVSRQVQRASGGKVDIRAPKYGSERVVFLPDELLAMLAAHVEPIGVRPAGWLFVGTGDGPPHQDVVYTWWRKTLHDARVSGSSCTTFGTSTPVIGTRTCRSIPYKIPFRPGTSPGAKDREPFPGVALAVESVLFSP